MLPRRPCFFAGRTAGTGRPAGPRALVLAPRPRLRQRLCTNGACKQIPTAPRVRLALSLLPAGARYAARNTQDPTCSDRGARPSALGLRCHRAHGMTNGTKLLEHANGYLTQP